jgi:hypothetical protein
MFYLSLPQGADSPTGLKRLIYSAGGLDGNGGGGAPVSSSPVPPDPSLALSPLPIFPLASPSDPPPPDASLARETAELASSYRLRILSFSCSADAYAGVVDGPADELGPAPEVDEKPSGWEDGMGGAMGRMELDTPFGPGLGDGGTAGGVVNRGGASGGGLSEARALEARWLASSYKRRIRSFSSVAEGYDDVGIGARLEEPVVVDGEKGGGWVDVLGGK